MGFLVLIVLFGAMYVFLILPQQRRMKAHQKLLAELEEGDEVVTSSGIHGVIVEVEPQIIWVEVAPNLELKMSRGSVAEVIGDDDADSDDDESDDGAGDEADELEAADTDDDR